MHPPNPISSLLRRTDGFAELSVESCDQIAQLTGERTMAAGEYLAQEGDAGDELYIVVSGSLILTQQSAASGEPLQLGTVGPAEVTGELSLLTGHARAASLQAAEITVVRTLASADFDKLCAEHPEEMAATVAWMTARVDAYQIATAIEESPLLRSLPLEARRDMAAGFVRVDLRAGQMLFAEGDAGDALYLILSGRVRVRRGSSGGRAASEIAALAAGPRLTDLGKGDILGELALLTGEARSASAVAIRDSHLARLDKPAFDRIVAAHPTEVLGLFSRQLAGRLRQQDGGGGRKAEGRVPVAIAVLPLTAPVQSAESGGARNFAAELVRQLSAFGPTLHLNRDVIDRVFPAHRSRQDRSGKMVTDMRRLTDLTDVAERRLLAWLDDLEMLYRHIVYEADYQTGAVESAWTQRCLRQADALLVVAGGPSDPRQSEKTMVRLTQKALPSVKTTLVLLHDSGPGTIAHTRMWKQVMGIANHEHVRLEAHGQISPADVGRIARVLNRQSVGLALGGGFALGLAHIGVVDAMREMQIPIDFVGGTSMGAIIAAACAQEFSHEQMIEVMEVGCAQSLKGDYTLPMVSLLTGKKVNRELGKYLEHLDIEDLWLPYFAVSASLVHARMVVHTSGSALRSVVASCRAPGMFPPLCWDGDVLVDGGLVNNVPADVMREAISRDGGGEGGSGTVFAVDVSPETEFTGGPESGFDFGMHLSGWQAARRNFNPFRRGQKMGTLSDVLLRLIRLGGVAHKQQIKASADLYMTLPLEKFSIRDFHRGAEISKVGYDNATRELEGWIALNGRPWLGGS